MNKWIHALNLGLLVGCTTQDAVYRDLLEMRSASVRSWKRSRKPDNRPDAHVEGNLALKDSVKLALLNNKSLAATLEERAIAEGRRLESYSGVLPTASVGASYARLDSEQEAVIPGTTIPVGELDNYSVGLTVTQPLYRSGASQARVRAALIGRVQSDELVRATVQKLIFTVSVQYHDILLAQHLYEANEAAVASARQQLTDVQAKRQQGAASEYDVIRAQVELSNFQAETIQQRNRIRLGKSALFKSLGISQESDVRLSDPLQYVAFKAEYAQAVQVALRNRPELHLADLGLQKQKELLKVAKSQYGPQANAFFDYQYARPAPLPFGDPDEWDDRWAVGVQLNFLLFDGFGREGRVAQEAARLRQRGVERMDVEERVLLEVRQALLSIRDAEEFVQSQAQNLQRAAEALRLAEVGYREGVRTLVDVTDARAALTQARGLYYQSIHTHTIARLQLQLALGVLGPRPAESEKGVGERVTPGRMPEFEEK